MDLIVAHKKWEQFNKEYFIVYNFIWLEYRFANGIPKSRNGWKKKLFTFAPQNVIHSHPLNCKTGVIECVPKCMQCSLSQKHSQFKSKRLCSCLAPVNNSMLIHVAARERTFRMNAKKNTQSGKQIKFVFSYWLETYVYHANVFFYTVDNSLFTILWNTENQKKTDSVITSQKPFSFRLTKCISILTIQSIVRAYFSCVVVM